MQKCLHREYHYAPYDIYGNTEETTTILAHSTNTWSLCNNASLFNENSVVKSDEELDNCLLDNTIRMVHQGMLDNCDDFLVSTADLGRSSGAIKTKHQTACN